MLKFLGTLPRWKRAAQVFCMDIPLHWRQRGKDLPSLATRIIEQGRLLALSGITATNYYRYRLYRQDLSPAQKASFLGFSEMWRWQIPLGAREVNTLLTDKQVFCKYMVACGVPVPEVLKVIGQPLGLHPPSVQQAQQEIFDWLKQVRPEDIFIKHLAGIGGSGVLSLGRLLSDRPTWECLPQGPEISLTDIGAHIEKEKPPFIIQQRERSHPVLSTVLGEGVLHTLRVVTVLDEGEVQLAQVTLKIGIGLSPADNFARGNMYAGVNPVSGKVRRAYAQKQQDSLVWIFPQARHPRTDQEISGLQLPLWPETLAVISAAAKAFYFAPVLWWDVAITDRGPVLLEANPVPDLSVTQAPNDQGLLATPLGPFLVKHNLLSTVGLGLMKKLPL